MFGYASLLDRRDRDDDDGRPAGLADLTGYRRSWGVAMDNSLDIPGYKYYVDPATGSRPDVFVAFLTISASPGGRVNGALIEVSAGDLVELDRRERNYARVDVTDRLARAADGTDRLAGAAGVTGEPGVAAGGTVWSYVGTPEARERFADGQRAGRVVIQEDYYEGVTRAFAAAAPGGRAEFERLTARPSCPIVGLRRVAL